MLQKEHYLLAYFCLFPRNFSTVTFVEMTCKRGVEIFKDKNLFEEVPEIGV